MPGFRRRAPRPRTFSESRWRRPRRHRDGGGLRGAVHGGPQVLARGKRGHGIPRERVARARRVDGLHLHGRHEEGLGTGHTAAGAPAAECEDEVHVRIPALEKRHQAGGLNAFGLVSQKAPRLGLVDDERVEPFERRLEKRSVEGRRIEDGAQTTFERSFDKARSVGELVLQHHDVVLLAGVERKQHALHRHAAVGAGIVEDAVLAVLRHLDEGVAARLGLVHGQHRDVDAFALEHFKKHTAVGTHATRMEDRRSRASKRHRLVETLATRMHGAVRGRKRLAGTHEAVDAIDVVKVERADVEDCHVRCRQ